MNDINIELKKIEIGKASCKLCNKTTEYCFYGIYKSVNDGEQLFQELTPVLSYPICDECVDLLGMKFIENGEDVWPDDIKEEVANFNEKVKELYEEHINKMKTLLYMR